MSKQRPSKQQRDELREFEVAVTPDGELIEQYFDREAGELELGELVQRVAKSTSSWQQIAETQHLVDELSAPVPTPDFVGPVFRRLEADPASPLRPQHPRRSWRAARGLFAAAILLTLSVGLWSRLGADPWSANDSTRPTVQNLIEGSGQDVQQVRQLADIVPALMQFLPTGDLRIEAPRRRVLPVMNTDALAPVWHDSEGWRLPGLQKLPLRQRDREDRMSIPFEIPDAARSDVCFI